MITPKVNSTGMQELRSIINKVPTNLRNLARTERREIQKLELQQPGTASYVLSRGGLENNAKLSELIKTLKAKNASAFYQRQPMGAFESAAQSTNATAVVKADMIL